MEAKETTPKERVQIELKELQTKIDKLSSFALSHEKLEKAGITMSMRGLLIAQIRAMREYENILVFRLLIWDEPEEEIKKMNLILPSKLPQEAQDDKDR